MTRETISEKLKQKKSRLESYLKREETMLNNGVQSYGIGSRNIARYNTDLASIQQQIKTLETEIDELQRKLDGGSARKAVGVIIRDW